MARLDQLNLKPQNETRQRSTDEQRAADEFIAQAEELLDHDRYRFAFDTITGMRDSVRNGQQPTQKMYQALQNIQQGARRQDAQTRAWGRRYEGHGR